MSKVREIKQDPVYRARRKTFADFLMGKGRLKNKEVIEDHFSLRFWMRGGVSSFMTALEQEKIGCGTTACIAGFCPVAFPREWRWRGDCYPVLEKDASGMHFSVISSFSDFFGVTNRVSVMICNPRVLGNEVVYNGPFKGALLDSVTAEQAGTAILSMNDEIEPEWVREIPV